MYFPDDEQTYQLKMPQRQQKNRDWIVSTFWASNFFLPQKLLPELLTTYFWGV